MLSNPHQHRSTDPDVIQQHPRRSAESKRPTKPGASRLLRLKHLQSRVLRVVVDDHQANAGGCLRFRLQGTSISFSFGAPLPNTNCYILLPWRNALKLGVPIVGEAVALMVGFGALRLFRLKHFWVSADKR